MIDSETNGPTPLDLNRLTPEQRYLYEERAGIIEFCGNVPRRIAEQEAWSQMRMGLQTGTGPQPKG